MAVRRLLGSSSMKVILRIMMESVLFTLFCFMLGYIIADGLSILAERYLNIKVYLDLNLELASLYLLLVLVTGVVSGPKMWCVSIWRLSGETMMRPTCSKMP